MKIELPQVGESVAEGIIGKWLKRPGDRIDKYEPLVEVVTDKVDMEVPSPFSGVLTSILVEEGQTVSMGTPIAEMEVDGGDEAAPAAEADRVTHAAASELEAIDRIGVLLKGVAPVGPTGSGGPAQVSPDLSPVARPEAPVARPRDAARPVRRYSPGVQRLAEEYGVDLSLVTGTGMGGRVSRKDVQEYVDSTRGARAAADTQEPGPDEARVPLTPVRRIIAENMIKSASQIPQAWSITEVDVTNLVQRRELAVADVQSREGVNLTYLPFVLQAVAAALLENPLLNSSWGGDCIVMKRRVNLGIAVAAPEGLVVPVIRDAESLSIVGLARVVDDLTSRARQGKLVLEDVRGGTFTVNNTGVLGSVASQPLVNPPQAAIMTTEAIVRRPVVMGDAIVIRSMMNLCLTFDHRVMDGADVGAFTTAVKRRLEAIGPDAAIY